MSLPPLPTDLSALAAKLREVAGADAVLDDPDDLLVYECDAYTLERRPPALVALPRTTAQVAAIVKLCAGHNIPIIPRGAGTSLSGSVLAVAGGVISGTALIRPDLPELKVWPYFWQQTEYVLGGGETNYMFLVLAVNQLYSRQ